MKVHVLLDWVGSAKMDESLIRTLTAAGVSVQKFHAPHWSHLGRMNNRTHRKLLIVDGLLVSVGSMNFDKRSFRLNDEATLNVVDPSFAAAQTATFEADLGLSRRVTHTQWLERPLREPVGEALATLIGTQL